MAKDRNLQKQKGIVKVSGSTSWLQHYQEEDRSLDALQAHVVVPRLKLIQGLTEKGLKDEFGEGSCIIRPGDALIVSKDESFMFVPLFFFVEYCKWADRKDKTNPMIMARSFDPTSDIAKRSQSMDLRFEIYQEDASVKPDKQRRFRYVEHYNFVGRIYGEHDLSGTEVTLSFSKGEHGQGKSFITACSLRKVEVEGEDGRAVRVRCPLWSQVWALTPALRERAENQWYGLDFTAGEPTVIREEDGDAFRQRALELQEAYDQRRLLIDGDDRDEETAEPTNAKF